MRRKALSPVIATLLMVAIAVAAAIITYVWSMGLLGGLMGTGGQQTKEQLVIDAYDWTTTGSLKLYLRNVGTVGSEVDKMYVEGVDQAFAPATGVIAPATRTAQITVTVTVTVTAGVSYTLKIVTKSGAVLTFALICGRAS